ncbi:MAG TPA: amidase [Burkholderiaceae bacterium]|nr:amidase [Burkholderiaceae bacterium]
MQITDLSACALAQAIRSRDVSCREVMKATLDRIAVANPVHNAIVNLRDADALLTEADQRDRELGQALRAGKDSGPLHGLPQAIKDMSQTAGLRTTYGSPLMRDFVPTKDGLMVQRMKAAGCIVIGKTNTPEFGLGSHTFNEVFGVTRNAYDPSRTAGGSSGGAAVALATRMLSVADGSDTMGSLRNPAAWNNVFGMRPSQGRVPFWPLQDVWVTQLGTEGPMGRHVRDVAMLLEVQAGFDPRTPLSLSGKERYSELLQKFDPRDVRIGWLGDLAGHLAIEPGILQACESGLARLRDAGCGVEVVAPGFSPPEVWRAWLVVRQWLVAARLAPFLDKPENRARIKPEALWEADEGARLSSADVMAASVKRTQYLQQMLALFEQCDFLALPTAQVWPFDAQERWPRQIAGRTMDTYHRWMETTLYATFAGLPAISVPVGFNAEGVPAGMQLIGRPRDDLGVLQLAFAYEQTAQEILQRRPADVL